MGLAFGVVSGAGPVAGLYSGILTGLFAAVFGGTPTQISGPTGPIAIVMASVIAEFASTPVAAFAVVMLAGAIQVGFGVLRFGRYINLMPYPVTSGFATGVGCIIILMQIDPLLGHDPAISPLETARTLPAVAAEANPAAIVTALACAFACVFMPRRLRVIVPTHLIVLVAGSGIIALAGVDVPTLAAPATLLPTLQWPHVTALPWQDMWIAAFVLAMVSSLDSLLTSITADTATQNFHDSDRELVGQGIGNLAAGLLGALPGSGSTFRTMANIRFGGRTPLSGIVHSAALATLLLGLGWTISYVPNSVLAGILIYIGFGIIDWGYIRRFPYAPRGGVVIMLVVWLTAVFVNVVTAAAIGIVMASLVFVKRMADLQLEAIEAPGARRVARLDDAEKAALERCAGQALYLPLTGPLTFGAAHGLSRRLANIGNYRVIVLEFSEVPHIDESATMALVGIIQRALNSGQHVILVGLSSAIVREFAQLGRLPLLKRSTRKRRRLDALNYAADIVEAEKAKPNT